MVRSLSLKQIYGLILISFGFTLIFGFFGIEFSLEIFKDLFSFSILITLGLIIFLMVRNSQMGKKGFFGDFFYFWPIPNKEKKIWQFIPLIVIFAGIFLGLQEYYYSLGGQDLVFQIGISVVFGFLGFGFLIKLFI